MKIKEDILEFTIDLREADKWKDKKWVQEQYDHRIQETTDLRNKKDPHLQAELLDKAIIAGCLYKIEPSNIDKLNNSIDDLKSDIVANGTVEFATYDELLKARKDKFISKLHLNGKSKESKYIITLKEYEIPNIYYIKSGTHNNAVMEYNHQKLRYRGEVLVFRNNFKEVFLCETDKDYRDDGNYYLPGGSAEPNKSMDDQISAETREEAGFEIKNLQHSGVQYIKDFNGNYPAWHAKYLHNNGLVYDGYFTELFVAEYDSDISKEVKNKSDIDPYMRDHGKFYNIESVRGMLDKEHILVTDRLQSILANSKSEVHAKDTNIPEASKYFIYEKDGKTYSTKKLIRSQLIEITVPGAICIHKVHDNNIVNCELVLKNDMLYVSIIAMIQPGRELLLFDEDYEAFINKKCTYEMSQEFSKYITEE